MQRASTPKGPINDRAIRGNQKVAGLPSLPKKSFALPSNRSIARIPRKGTRTPVSKMPMLARPKWPSLICPTTRGNTRLPEPKNMENMARPVDKIKALFFILRSIKPIALYINAKIFTSQN